VARILYLVHRMPYPPNKGDKVRSYHLLRHLAQRHEVYLGTFIDDASDVAHVNVLRQWCAEVRAVRLRPAWARLMSLTALGRGEPLTQAYYRSRALHHWVSALVDRVDPEAVVAFSSPMAQYAAHVNAPLLMDLVDLDSEKWADYARTRRFPMSFVLAREARKLLALETEIVRRARYACFVTPREAALFKRRAGPGAGPVHVVRNGVDSDYFDPALPMPSPFVPGEVPVVFTGAMDYPPNVDAMVWFCTEVWPELVKSRPSLNLHIVGRHPALAVRTLAAEQVRITGTVDDVRPYLRHAALAVAPMRLARGIHNKILEGMAMGRAVVTSEAAAESLEPALRACVLRASDAAGFKQAIESVLDSPELAADIGQRARTIVMRDCNWSASLAGFDGPLQRCLAEVRQ
jgi:polysaccharide biosynthesis protein PslH